MMINIAKNYRQYSPEDLRDMAYRGTLEANGLDISDFLEYIFQDMVSQDELDKAVEDAETAGRDYCADCGELM